MASELCPQCRNNIPSRARDHWATRVCFKCVSLHPSELEGMYDKWKAAEATIESLRGELAAERAKARPVPVGRRLLVSGLVLDPDSDDTNAETTNRKETP